VGSLRSLRLVPAAGLASLRTHGLRLPFLRFGRFSALSKARERRRPDVLERSESVQRSATLPYRELGNFPGAFPTRELGVMQPPFVPQMFMPWQNIPRFIPPTYGVFPYMDPRMLFNVDPRMMFNPYIHNQAFYPYTQPFNVNPPLYNFGRPFIG
jgi:hypothetical protein